MFCLKLKEIQFQLKSNSCNLVRMATQYVLNNKRSRVKSNTLS